MFHETIQRAFPELSGSPVAKLESNLLKRARLVKGIQQHRSIHDDAFKEILSEIMDAEPLLHKNGNPLSYESTLAVLLREWVGNQRYCNDNVEKAYQHFLIKGLSDALVAYFRLHGSLSFCFKDIANLPEFVTVVCGKSLSLCMSRQGVSHSIDFEIKRHQFDFENLSVIVTIKDDEHKFIYVNPDPETDKESDDYDF